MQDIIKKLIKDRKARLVSFIFGETAKYFTGERKELANVDEAKEDNEESDREALKKFNMVFVSGLAEIADGWYNNKQEEVLIF